jgi:tRNA/rRNA methyltransferase
MIEQHAETPTESTLDAVRVVLVRPQGAANVGAAARAMKNMGVRELTLVRPDLRRRFWAHAMAARAGDVLDRARTVDSLPEAVADCRLVVGTTCRGGLYRSAAEPPEAVAADVIDVARHGPVALVFGPEDHGLTNSDLKCCHRLITIPAAGEYPSLNLGQAVLLCCYVLRRAACAGHAVGPRVSPAPAADVGFALDRLQESLLRIGFLNPDNPDHIMFAFRRIFGRAGLEARDVRIILGLARQIDWYARDGWREHVEECACDG